MPEAGFFDQGCETWCEMHRRSRQPLGLARRLGHLQSCLTAADPSVHGDAAVKGFGWVAAVPPNGRLNRASLATVANGGLATAANELETTPEHRNHTEGDPSCEGWVRTPTDPGVAAFRARLQAENGAPARTPLHVVP